MDDLKTMKDSHAELRRMVLDLCHKYEPRKPGMAAAIMEIVGALALAVDSAELARMSPPKGYIRLPDGRDVKMLGDAAENMTADGCIALMGAGVWEPGQMLPGPNLYGQSMIRLSECYSTAEAAKQAAEKVGEVGRNAV